MSPPPMLLLGGPSNGEVVRISTLRAEVVTLEPDAPRQVLVGLDERGYDYWADVPDGHDVPEGAITRPRFKTHTYTGFHYWGHRFGHYDGGQYR